MKSRDGLLVLIVIGVAGALSFVAYQYGLQDVESDGAAAPQTAAVAGPAEDAASAGASDKDAGSEKPPTRVANEGEPPTASAAVEEAPLVAVEAADAATGGEAVAEAAEDAVQDAAESAAVEENETPAAVIDAADVGASEPIVADARTPDIAATAEDNLPPDAAEASMAAQERATPDAIGRDEPSPSGLPTDDLATATPTLALPDQAPEAPAPSVDVVVAPEEPAASFEAPAAQDDVIASAVDVPPRRGPWAAVQPPAPPPLAGFPCRCARRYAGQAPRVALDRTGVSSGLDAPNAFPSSSDAPIASTAPDAARPDDATIESARSDVPPPTVSAALEDPRPDVNDPASFPEEPGRGFVSLETAPPEDVTPPEIARPALGAPLVDGAEDVAAASRDVESNVEPAPEDPVARAVRDGGDFVETPVSPVPPDPAESAEKDIRPTFDVVRVGRDGSGVLAGRAEPGALVTVLVDGLPSEQVRADPRGEFVVLLTAPDQPPLSIRFDLEAENDQGEVVSSVEPVIVTLPDDPARRPIVVQPTVDGVQLLGPVGPATEDGRVVIQSVTYGAEGDVTIAGSGAPGEVARVYLDNGLEAEARVSPDGDWRVQLAREVPPAIYTLRVDQLTSEGIISSRAETPFERAPTDLVLREGTVVVQPGNNLWMIADHVYGSGARYTIIYDSNRDQIRDPDLIYPGQVLSLPDTDPAVISSPG